ncbi:uncharacterized protein [Clytia hemisphaerica]|uniref:C2H2-type domain-containing protein n=2 Tax=Clytia hemisphaerica TaxID=252671 RepID=A0A7M5WQC5_9CNID
MAGPVELDFDELSPVFEEVEDIQTVDLFEKEAAVPVSFIHEEDISDVEDETTMDTVPTIVFVNEETLQTILPQSESDVSDSKPLFKCDLCQKEYFRERGIKTHKKTCKGSKAQSSKKPTAASGKPKKPIAPKKKTPAVLLKEKFLNSSVNILETSLKSAADDPFFMIREPGKSAALLASKLIPLSSNENAKIFVEGFIKAMHEKLKKKSVSKPYHINLFKLFNKQCFADEHINNWKLFLALVGSDLDQTRMLFNFVTSKILEQLLKIRREFFLPDTSNKEIYVSVTGSELQTIRYVCGYLLFSLKKSLRNDKTLDGKATMEVLKSWGYKDFEDEFDDNIDEDHFTLAWVQAVNRGSLIYAVDDFFHFIKHIELSTKKLLHQKFLANYKGDDIREMLRTEFSANLNVERCWQKLTMDIPNENIKSKIRSKIIGKWINLRINGFIKSVLNIRKLNAKKNSEKSETVSEAGEPGIRKLLATKK